MRHQKTSNKRRPPWLTYAAKVKARIEKLKPTKTYAQRREKIVYLSFQEVKEKHRYVGTLGDWDFVVGEIDKL